LEDALANPPVGVPQSDWEQAVHHWSSDETKARASINAGIRARGPEQTHVLGRASIGRVQHLHVSILKC